ncbi:MAG: phage tail length tape measure family protein [Sphaerochaetaceae bacterium]|nr:phage tail length tape measure family protein [Spirochaetales bacterium]MDY5499168.1 phage tail length tape measure family protein [Sphaerochaetaceae bacterium]
MSVGGIKIPITATTTQAVAALRDVSSKVDQIAKAHVGLRGSIQTIAALGVAYHTVSSTISTMVNAGKALVSEYAAGAKQTITMQSAVKTMGTQMGVTTKDVFELATSLKQVTTYDNDTLIGVQQLLIATKSLSKDGLKQATKASLDLATAMGTDAKSAASSLARALADPADNIRALRSANIQFTDAEEDQIKTLQKSGKLWDAQQIILEKVEKTYGGMAKAVGDTDVGKLDRITGAMGDLRESLGGALVNAISPYLDHIYDSIVRIQSWIDEHNAATSLSMALQNGGSLADFDTSALTERYIQRSRERSSLLVDIAQSGLLDASGNVIDPASLGAANNPTASELYRSWTTLNDEMTRITRELASRNAASTLSSAVPAAAGGGAVSASSDTMLTQYGSLSQSYQLRQKQHDLVAATLEWAKADDGSVTKQYWNEIRTAIRKQIDDMLKPVASGDAPNVTSAIGDFLSSHAGMSTTMQVADIDSQLAQAKALRLKGGMSDMEADSIQEVIDKLQKQKDELLGISDANEQVQSSAEKYAEAYAESTKYISQATQMLSAFQELGNQLMQNDVDELTKRLDDAKSAWDDYFDNLERRQETQKTSLAVMYDEGLISAEDYISAMTDLDDSYEDAKKQRQDEEDALEAEANKAKEKQFNANKLNSIAQVLIQGAQATAAVWANPGWPAAIPLTVMLGAMNTAQVATIAAQKYTPMAVGGIVSKPTHAYIGEGAEAEAVMPLSHLSRMLSSKGMDATGGGVINISISMGDVYDPDQIAEQVYQGINRAQERGVLPAWSVR